MNKIAINIEAIKPVGFLIKELLIIITLLIKLNTITVVTSGNQVLSYHNI